MKGQPLFYFPSRPSHTPSQSREYLLTPAFLTKTNDMLFPSEQCWCLIDSFPMAQACGLSISFSANLGERILDIPMKWI